MSSYTLYFVVIYDKLGAFVYAMYLFGELYIDAAQVLVEHIYRKFYEANEKRS